MFHYSLRVIDEAKMSEIGGYNFFSDQKDIFAKYRGKKRLKNAISQNSNFGKITTLRNEF